MFVYMQEKKTVSVFIIKYVVLKFNHLLHIYIYLPEREQPTYYKHYKLMHRGLSAR